MQRPAQRAERGVVLDVAARVPAAGPAQQHVELHVHEAGQQRHVAEVDLGRAVRQLGRVDRGDAFALDDDHRRRPHLARVDVDPPIGAQNDGASGVLGSRPGLDQEVEVRGAGVGDVGWRHASTGNDTMTSE